MRGIEKHFGSVRALNGASLQVKPGEIQALLGSNGSGKSTIVKIMGGVLRANAGQMLLDGEPIQINSVFDARRFGIAVAYQELSLLPQMSVMDNILLGHELCGKAGLIDRRRQRERVCALLDRLQIKCSPEALVQNISPSEQSMVEVAKALERAPKFLLLDEVTAALHHDEVEALFAVLREEREKGTSILIVTHRMNEIYRLCDRATIFRNGETVIQEAMDRLPLNDVVFYMTGTCVSGEGESCAAPAPVETEALLSAEELVLHPQVKGISLHVNKGEIVGIGGLEGQGQTQYIKALYGALQPEKGTLRFEGKPVKLRSTDRAVRRGICYVSGDRTREAVFSLRSIEENLTAGEMALGSACAPRGTGGGAALRDQDRRAGRQRKFTLRRKSAEARGGAQRGGAAEAPAAQRSDQGGRYQFKTRDPPDLARLQRTGHGGRSGLQRQRGAAVRVQSDLCIL